ncbi:MAG: hypothetical protein KGH60_02565 [Candidatus Micrarchaeota archaeon]|nr:hypothetical protein [Candidatus Micrarchaeota archaeon]
MDEKISGIVTAVKMQPNPIDNVYTILSDRVYRLRSGIDLKLMERVSGVASGGALTEVEVNGQATEKEYKETVSRHIDGALSGKRLLLEGKPYADLVARMTPRLLDAARTLLERLVTGAPVIVRFHNDGDGASGAIGLYRAVCSLQDDISEAEFDVSWRMNRSIAYTTEAFYSDELRFNGYNSVAGPLVLITDFGTTEESLEAIKLAKGRLELVWMDHHKPYDGFPRGMIGNYINTWDFGGDSALSAGAMTCIFSRLFSDADSSDMIEASFVSDYSPYAETGNKRANDISLMLDYFTSRGGSYPPVTPKQIDAIITDDGKSAEMVANARHSLEEAMRAGLSNIRRYSNNNGINIHVLDFGHVANLGLEYPLPGRFSSKLQSHLESLNNGRTMTIVHYGSYISMRVSRDILGSIDVLQLIARLKESDATIGGGGHREAASIRTTKEKIPDLMKLLLIELGAQI